LAKEDAMTAFAVGNEVKPAMLASQSYASENPELMQASATALSVDSHRAATSYDMTAVTDKG
jgi:hypothetical protein